jgi:hypothetical protein
LLAGERWVLRARPGVKGKRISEVRITAWNSIPTASGPRTLTRYNCIWSSKKFDWVRVPVRPLSVAHDEPLGENAVDAKIKPYLRKN